MNQIKDFYKNMAQKDLSEIERAVGIIWLKTELEEHDDCTVSEIISIFHECKDNKPNSSRLSANLKKAPETVTGHRKNSFRISSRFHDEIDSFFKPMLNIKITPKSDSIIPMEWVEGKRRPYLVSLAKQINVTYDMGFYDAVAVLSRRLMESLIIGAYFTEKRENEIKDSNGEIKGLDTLIGKAKPDFSLSRNMPRYMNSIKDKGDTAAHHRTYITRKEDIDHTEIRKTIHELLEKNNLLS